MRRIMSTRRFADALKAEGFPLPEHCKEARLIVGVNAAFLIQYDVFLDGENLDRLGRALQHIALDDVPVPVPVDKDDEA